MKTALGLVLALFLVACGAPPARNAETVERGATKQGNGAASVGAMASSSEEDVAVPIAADDPVRGPRNALVTIVVFTDFQCPFCSRMVPTLERIREEYGDQVRFVHKNEPLPFHEHAARAAEIGVAVFELKGSEAFFAYHDGVFRDQRNMDRDSLLRHAAAVGVDARTLEAGFRAKKWLSKIERDQALAERLGARGTPHSFINGVSLSGAQPYPQFREIIDSEIVKAKEFLKRGVAPDKLYALLVASNPPIETKPPERADAPDDLKDDPTVWKVPVGASPVRGSANAVVTIVEFSDFQCPFCKKVGSTLERVRNEYGERVRIVWKDRPLPFHPRAEPAAALARVVRAQKGDAAFWDVHDRLFASQPQLEDADLERAATQAGADGKKAMVAVAAGTFKKAIALDQNLADDLEASGTPTFFINGRRLVGAQPFEKFKALIDEELTKAEALVRSGVAKSSVYEKVIKDGRAAANLEQKVVAVSASSPFRGAPNARVVVQEFGDFQCPFCQRAEQTLDDLLKEFPGNVKIVWRDLPLPFHPDAMIAAEAAREAFAQKGNDGFSKMRVLLFQHQRDQDGLKRPALETYARTIGLDMNKFQKALDTHVHRAAIEADAKAAEDAKIQGTPSFTVGTYFVSGAQPIGKFRSIVGRVLAESKPSPPLAK